ncbi:MAG: DUF2949 domain-containing protein [Synechococcaceae cyanobacterium SM2_3_1]|nr:DUF2949 domain-containing protein [Synechococcaceae cyanobacterium SM2_3_1]
MLNPMQKCLIQFLQEEMAVPEAAIRFAMKRHQRECGPLQIILWQYGLISMEQLQQVFVWLAAPSFAQSCFDTEVLL